MLRCLQQQQFVPLLLLLWITLRLVVVCFLMTVWHAAFVAVISGVVALLAVDSFGVWLRLFGVFPLVVAILVIRLGLVECVPLLVGRIAAMLGVSSLDLCLDYRLTMMPKRVWPVAVESTVVVVLALAYFPKNHPKAWKCTPGNFPVPFRALAILEAFERSALSSLMMSSYLLGNWNWLLTR